MIFQHTFEQVLNKTKIQTSRIQKPGDESVVGVGFVGVVRNKRTLYEVGKTYAVQPHRNHEALLYCPAHPCFGIDIIQPGDDHYRLAKSGKWNYAGQGYIRARIRILEITPADVRQFGEAEIKAEGFDSWLRFMSVWTAMHDKQCPTLEIGSTTDDIAALIMSRPAALYTAWVLRFELV